MIDDIRAAHAAALEQVEAADSPEAVAALDGKLLGKQSTLAGFKKQLGGLATVEEKKAAGRAVNEAMQAVAAAIAARAAALADIALDAQVQAERLDLTEYAGKPRRGHAHLATQAWMRLEDVFIGLGFRVAEGPEVETDWHNFEALNMGEGHPARGEFDTLFLDADAHAAGGGDGGGSGDAGGTGRDGDAAASSRILLRTHTSPVQIRTMLEQEPPIYIIAPGRVFRRDTPDATHMPVFHQLEGLVVDRDITLADLAGTIEAFTKAFFGPGFSSRLRPNYFPFTEPSAEFDIQRPDGSWLELGGCGMVHPNVLRAGGIDPEEWSGFAFGFGIDRMAVLRHQVGDLRDMYTNDMRFVKQF